MGDPVTYWLKEEGKKRPKLPHQPLKMPALCPRSLAALLASSNQKKVTDWYLEHCSEPLYSQEFFFPQG